MMMTTTTTVMINNDNNKKSIICLFMYLLKSPAPNYEASTSKGGNKYMYANKSKDKTTQLVSFRQ
jgi:hypothetical protein